MNRKKWFMKNSYSNDLSNKVYQQLQYRITNAGAVLIYASKETTSGTTAAVKDTNWYNVH